MLDAGVNQFHTKDKLSERKYLVEESSAIDEASLVEYITHPTDEFNFELLPFFVLVFFSNAYFPFGQSWLVFQALVRAAVVRMADWSDVLSVMLERLQGGMLSRQSSEIHSSGTICSSDQKRTGGAETANSSKLWKRTSECGASCR